MLSLKKHKKIVYLIFFPYLCTERNFNMFLISFILVSALAIGLYAIMMGLTNTIIREDLDNCLACVNYYPIEVDNFIHDYFTKLIPFLSCIWPLYHLFRLGAIFGRKIYLNIIENYENRIAAWFI